MVVVGPDPAPQGQGSYRYVVVAGQPAHRRRREEGERVADEGRRLVAAFLALQRLNSATVEEGHVEDIRYKFS